MRYRGDAIITEWYTVAIALAEEANGDWNEIYEDWLYWE